MIHIFPVFYFLASMEIVLQLDCKCASFAFVVYALLYFTYREDYQHYISIPQQFYVIGSVWGVK